MKGRKQLNIQFIIKTPLIQKFIETVILHSYQNPKNISNYKSQIQYSVILFLKISKFEVRKR